MRELVMATIADQPDIEVVGEVQNETDLADIVEQVLPDVLIIAMDSAGPGSHSGKARLGFRKWAFAKPVRTTLPFGNLCDQFEGFLLRRSASNPSAAASDGWCVSV
jgi:hypothetical protein